MSKYIVTNCPAITDGRNIQNICTNANACCELISDCLIKQVIEKCEEHVDSLCPCPDEGKGCIECTIAEEEYIACQLIQLFEIEECNDDV